ncbi:hypothetical protein [Roseobacter sp. OBYS 0001]|uniref:hypothetical protein n=1 Tax=Roseobacter sp. OBYS 0001 TaxID=882651 RepID=UPI001BBEA7A4|nr:hypothetical protein [Roseobacter sp. OBYS 0001]GIT89282.1 hypothetical protein ROBYS_42980 [Roseobacter sp. OBYS 0001]
MRVFIFATILSVLFGATVLTAQTSVEKPLALDGSIASNGRAVELSWFDADPPRVGSVIVNRRTLGQTGADSWQALGPALGPVLRFTDDTTEPGVAYEYQVMRTARDIVDVGYWATGVEIPATEARGTAYLVVDETIAADLDAHLQRFNRDLLGDGWQVQRFDAPRGDLKDLPRNLTAALAVKTWLQGQYSEDPFGQHTVILIGHVPIVLSGRVGPDGHEAQPHATDLFYAEMDGQWRATPGGVLLENTLPSDAIEMQIGRIDLSPVSEGDKAREVALLRAYFDKNHHWRMGLLGDLRGAYGQSNHLTTEQYGLRNIVGPQAVEAGGHHDVGEREPWLWGVDFGHWKGSDYAAEYANKAVFAINFGSNKQKIERPFNAMTALLAQPWYPLAVGWGGRPAWWLHHMALGGTIGEVHRRTVNNGVAAAPYRETMDYFPTGNYLWRNPVWVNLLGDPTLRAFPQAPSGRVRTQQTDAGVQLSWEASPDGGVTGYRIWRAAPEDYFEPLDGGTPQTALTFLDTAPVADARYMVRAYGLKDVYAGSFYTLSQGAFSGLNENFVQSMTLATHAGQPAPLPQVFNTPQNDQIHAIIEGPAQGTVRHSDGGWHYTPSKGFTGKVDLRFSVSEAGRTEVGRMQIAVSP